MSFRVGQESGTGKSPEIFGSPENSCKSNLGIFQYPHLLPAIYGHVRYHAKKIFYMTDQFWQLESIGIRQMGGYWNRRKQS